MELTEFLSKNQIVLDEPVSRFCQRGIDLMKVGVDPLHDDDHVLAIIDNLDRFINENKEVDRARINFPVMLLAICWHDIWKSQRLSKNLVLFFYHFFWDGRGSARFFQKEAALASLDPETVQKAAYAIKKHTRIHLLSRRTLESKILKDLDTLEIWSVKRIRKAEEEAEAMVDLGQTLLKTAKVYLRFMHWLNDSSFYFAWSRREFEAKREEYFREANRLINLYSQFLFHNKKPPFPGK
ncbi:MAG: hypothetical protein HY577_00800 [Candidatus Nealsonbacteria bacterium]|nr:hypothetical protein [Candidatus Nealsonbacteria bacterium]